MTAISQKPQAIIFLDIDGVMVDDNTIIHKQFMETADRLFPGKTDWYQNPTQLFHETTVTSYFFNPTAITNLRNLITKVQEFAEPKIVISSNWRNHHTYETLQQWCFSHHQLDTLIIDTTTTAKIDSKQLCSMPFHFEQCRASEIKTWLKDHPEIQHFVILDDYDSHLSHVFPRNFVQTIKRVLLTEQNMEQAVNILEKSRNRTL